MKRSVSHRMNTAVHCGEVRIDNKRWSSSHDNSFIGMINQVEHSETSLNMWTQVPNSRTGATSNRKEK